MSLAKRLEEQLPEILRQWVAGAGVALVPSFLVEMELAQGALVQPFAITLESRQAYYLVYPHSKLGNASFLLFRKWLLQEASGMRKPTQKKHVPRTHQR